MPTIKLASHPEIKPSDEGRWELCLWVGDANYRTIPFRRFLDQMTALYPAGSASVALPAFKHGEDFLSGTLKVEDAELAIYSEQSPLSYLSISSKNRTALDDLRSRLQSVVCVTS